MKLIFRGMFFLFLFGVVAFPNIANGQVTGFIPPTSEEFEQFELKTPYFGARRGPPPKQDSIAHFFPKPGEQNQQNSCMGFAFAHAMMTSLERIQSRRISEPYSAAFLYNSTKEPEPAGECTKGVKPDKVIEVLRRHGVPSAKLVPFNSSRCDRIDADKANQITPRRKLKDIERINGKGVSGEISRRVKDAIANDKQPVVIGMPTGINFGDYRYGVYPSNFQTSSSDIIDEIVPADFYHAMVIVGYDQTRGFRVLNSYGLGWGDLGFGWIDSEFIEREDVWLWTANLGDLVNGDETMTKDSKIRIKEPSFGSSKDQPMPTKSMNNKVTKEPLFGNKAERSFVSVSKDKYEFGKELAMALRGTVGHNAAGQTPKGLDYYPVSLWLQLTDNSMSKLERVEYHWDAASYVSPKIPMGGSDTSFLIEYFGYGAVSQARIRVWLVDGTEYEIFYPFRSIWEYGSLNDQDLTSTIIKVNPKTLPECPSGSSRLDRGPCLTE